MFNIAVLVSGSGTNMTKIIENGIKINCVIADRNCKAITIAEKNLIKTFLIDEKNNFKDELLKILEERKIDLIVLAGFLSILDKKIINKYEKKIINIHPSLLPKYGGRGMYGINVHKAVFENNEKESGCTVHYVDENIDTGNIILQEKINIEKLNSPEEIQKKVLLKEWELLPKVIKKILEERKN